MFERLMVQKCTYWTPPTSDGYGGAGTFGAPTILDCFFQPNNELFLDPQGKEHRSRAVVYTTIQLTIGGYLFNGETAELDPRSLTDAWQIVQHEFLTGLRNGTVGKSWL